MKTVDALKKFLPLYRAAVPNYLCNTLDLMEQEGALTPEELKLLRRWILRGHKKAGRSKGAGFTEVARHLPPPTNARQRKFQELFLSIHTWNDIKSRRIEWIEYCIARYERGAK